LSILNIKKFVKYTIDETKDFVKDYNEPPTPDLVVIQPLTNDLKTMTPQNCVQSLQTLIVDIHFVELLIIFSFIRAFIICPFAWNFKLSFLGLARETMISVFGHLC
jgi:hypothetical protein